MMKRKVRLGVLGLGPRCIDILKVYKQYELIELVGLCDLYQKNLDIAREQVGLDDIPAYLSFGEMLDNCSMDALIIYIDPDIQVEYACMAMERGIHVMTEVPAAYSIEDCWKLVDTVEKTGMIYQLAEQTRYMSFLKEWRNLYKEGIIGKVLLIEGEYMHFARWGYFVDTLTGDVLYDMEHSTGGDYGNKISDIPASRRKFKRHWRYMSFEHPIYYLPHELSPMLSVINDRVTHVSCLSTNIDEGGIETHIKGIRDLEVALMKTEKGTVMRMAAGFTTCHPERGGTGSHWYHLKGTKADLETARSTMDTAKIWTPESKWQSKTWEMTGDDDADDLAKSSNHGGLDFYPIEAFVHSILYGEPVKMDVYRAVETAAPAILAARSAEQGGALLEVPDFRAKYGKPLELAYKP